MFRVVFFSHKIIPHKDFVLQLKKKRFFSKTWNISSTNNNFIINYLSNSQYHMLNFFSKKKKEKNISKLSKIFYFLLLSIAFIFLFLNISTCIRNVVTLELKKIKTIVNHYFMPYKML